MKILIVCDQGNNRSVVLAHHLKYWGHDTIPAGLSTNSLETLGMLMDWADRVITVDVGLHNALTGALGKQDDPKFQLWPIGPDHFPRPFNPELTAIIRHQMEHHKAEYKPE